MNILENLYQNPPKSREFLERKIRIEGSKILLKGANGSGKSSLILNHLSKFDNFLYMSFASLYVPPANVTIEVPKPPCEPTQLNNWLARNVVRL